MKNRTFLLVFVLFFVLFAQLAAAQSENEIRLLVRTDDVGSFTAANHASIDAIKNGIARAPQVMVPCSWFPEAAKLLNENPDIEVGIHLVLTSEWINCKWRPLTQAPSITDEDGYFYSYTWTGWSGDYSENSSLKEAKWKLSEIEAEFRAQIEMAKKWIPRASYISDHMYCADWNDEIREMLYRLADEYDLVSFVENKNMQHLPAADVKSDNPDPHERRVAEFISTLDQLEPGKTYFMYMHPALDTPEMRTVYHYGYDTVARDRSAEHKLLVDKRVADAIKQKSIKLIGYADLIPEVKAAEVKVEK